MESVLTRPVLLANEFDGWQRPAPPSLTKDVFDPDTTDSLDQGSTSASTIATEDPTDLSNTGELARQARIVRMLGSPFVAEVLAASERQLDRAPLTAALLRSWPGDPAAAALGMRFNGAIHAIARRRSSPMLTALYQREHSYFDETLGAVMAAEDAFIAAWMRDPPQTNEVGRAAAIFAALMVSQRIVARPIELLELGSSAGLNLNMARYAYDLGGVEVGDRKSPVRIAPTWNGPPPPAVAIDVVAARGVDLKPLDAGDAATRERLLAYVFADRPERSERLGEALTLAQRHPPSIDRADATTWLAQRLATPQPAGRCRAVFHSMVLQYLTADDRRAVINSIAAAGARADAERPLVWVGFEWTEARSEVRLMLTQWPDGETRHLATCHPYGAAIDWHFES